MRPRESRLTWPRSTCTASLQLSAVSSTGSGQGSGCTTMPHSTVTLGAGNVTWFALRVRVEDRLVDQLCPRYRGNVADKELQYGAFAGRCAQRGNAPVDLPRPRHGCRTAAGRRAECGDGKVRIHQLLNQDIRCARLGDILGQFRKKRVQIRRIRRYRHMGGVRIRGPVIQGVHVHAVGSHQADAVDEAPLGAGCCRNRSVPTPPHRWLRQ